MFGGCQRRRSLGALLVQGRGIFKWFGATNSECVSDEFGSVVRWIGGDLLTTLFHRLHKSIAHSHSVTGDRLIPRGRVRCKSVGPAGFQPQQQTLVQDSGGRIDLVDIDFTATAGVVQAPCIIEQVGWQIANEDVFFRAKFDSIGLYGVAQVAAWKDLLVELQLQQSLMTFGRDLSHPMGPEPGAISVFGFEQGHGEQFQRVRHAAPAAATEDDQRITDLQRQSQLLHVLPEVRSARGHEPILKHWEQVW